MYQEEAQSNKPKEVEMDAKIVKVAALLEAAKRRRKQRRGENKGRQKRGGRWRKQAEE